MCVSGKVCICHASMCLRYRKLYGGCVGQKEQQGEWHRDTGNGIGTQEMA